MNGESYLRIGYNLKPDGSYVGEGFMKPEILHQPKELPAPILVKPNIPTPKPEVQKPKPQPKQKPILVKPNRPQLQKPQEKPSNPIEREKKNLDLRKGAYEYQKEHKVSFPEALDRFELETESSLNLIPVETKTHIVQESGALTNLYGPNVKGRNYTYYELKDFNVPSLSEHETASGLTKWGNLVFINKSKSQSPEDHQSTIINEMSHAITHDEFPQLKQESSKNCVSGFRSSDLPNWRINTNLEADEFLSDVASINTYPRGEIRRIIANGIIKGGKYSYGSTESFMREVVSEITKTKNPEIGKYLKEGTEIPDRPYFTTKSEHSIGHITGIIMADPALEKKVIERYMKTGKALVAHLRKQKEFA